MSALPVITWIFLVKTLDSYHRRPFMGDLGRFAYAACNAIRTERPLNIPEKRRHYHMYSWIFISPKCFHSPLFGSVSEQGYLRTGTSQPCGVPSFPFSLKPI